MSGLLNIFVDLLAGRIAPKLKGWVGEFGISRILSNLSDEEYYTFNDVVLLSEKDITTQIDHIVVSIYGIFVIETKNYKGWISGSEFSEKWLKNMYGKKYYFYNPLRQNYAHRKVLENLLKLPEESFFPVIVFSNKAELKLNVKSPVIYPNQLLSEIFMHTDKLLDIHKYLDIIKIIADANVDSAEIKRKHIKNIRDNINQNKEDIRKNICPKCGGKLLERKGRYGGFIGCSNYPKCHFTINIDS